MASFLGMYAAPAAEIVVALLIHSDSRGRGVFTAVRDGADAPPTGLYQYASDIDSDGQVDKGWTNATLGISSPVPLAQAEAAAGGGTDYLSPAQDAARFLLANGASKVIILGSAWGGSTLLGNAFHAPFTKSKAAAGLTAIEAAYPTATVVPAIYYQYGVNDMTSGETPANLFTGTGDCIADLRTATGWSSAPVIGVCVTPEEVALLGNGGYGDAAVRNKVLQTTNTYWVQYPIGIGQLHEGDTYTIAEVREAGLDYIGPMIGTALGLVTPTAPTFSIPTNYSVEEGTATDVPLNCNQRVRFTVDAGSASFVELTGDYTFDVQFLRPVGGTWPAYDAGTPANNTRSYTLNWRAANGLTGSITRNIVITAEDTTAWLVYDDFNRADVAQTSGGLGNTSGKGGYGGSIAWSGLGGIRSNKAALTGNTVDPLSVVETGQLYKEVSAQVTITEPGSNVAQLYVIAQSGSYFLWWQNSGNATQLVVYKIGVGLGTVASGAALPAGTYDIKVGYYSDGTVKAYVDGVQTISGTPFAAPSGTDTKAGIGLSQKNCGVLFDNFRAVAV